jgi:hypothetical protein
MHRIKTSDLLIAAVLALLNGMMAMGDGITLRPVRDASGAVIYQRPGRILMERDYWADIRDDWFAYSSLAVAVCLFTWCLIRFVRTLWRKHQSPRI